MRVVRGSGENMKSLSFIIPTVDPERPLARCLLSLAKQPLGPHDEAIVVIDGVEGLKPGIEATVRSFGPQFKVVYLDTGHHCWGHCQQRWAAKFMARGDYINFNDDDDIWTPGAVERIRAEVDALPEPMPVIFQYRPTARRDALPNEHRIDTVGLSTHMIVFPNVKDKIPVYRCRPMSDRGFVIDTVQAWGGKVRWVDIVIQIARPSPNEWPEKWGEQRAPRCPFNGRPIL